MLKVGFESFLDFSFGLFGLETKSHFPFRKQVLGPVELVLDGITLDLLHESAIHATAA